MSQQLLDYIKKERGAGSTDDQIKQKLLEIGWSEKDITESLNLEKNTEALNDIVEVNYTDPKKLPKGLFISFLVVVFILIIGGGSYFLFQRDTEEKNADFSEDEIKYKNNLFGYEIKHEGSWRIATELSRKAAAMVNFNSLVIDAGCDIKAFDLNSSSNIDKETIMSEYKDCFDKNPNISKENTEFQKNWRIENSNLVILTQISKKEEIEALNSGIAITDFPGKTIQIYPGIGVYPRKEATSPTGSMEIKFYNPIDNNEAYVLDHKDIGYGRSLAVFVLKDIDYYIEDEKANALVIQTDIDEGSNLEQDFYKIVDSLHFIK